MDHRPALSQALFLSTRDVIFLVLSPGTGAGGSLVRLELDIEGFASAPEDDVFG